jgi:SAM-dependent MidA family methyltransferase
MPVAGELAGIVDGFPAREKGFTTEVCLAYRPLLQTLAAKIASGFLLAVDYGLSRESLLAEHRTDGTLSCYRGHRRDSNPLESPGQKDLTAHVNFSLLAQDAIAAGWQLGNFADQHHFLVGAATSLLLSMDGKTPDMAGRKKLLSLKMLLHPESMGRQFHAIVFSKGVTCVGLSGFQYAGKIPL